jgi:hypothetical protein
VLAAAVLAAAVLAAAVLAAAVLAAALVFAPGAVGALPHAARISVADTNSPKMADVFL